MSNPQEHLLDWLRDAHAMEQQAEQMLKAQASRIENYPKMKARVEQHLEETRGQQKLLEGCLERLGGSPSAVKDTMGTMAAMGQGLAGMFTSDEIVKGATPKRSACASRSWPRKRPWRSGCWTTFPR